MEILSERKKLLESQINTISKVGHTLLKQHGKPLNRMQTAKERALKRRQQIQKGTGPLTN